jgi:hypothetical protein
MLTVAVTVAFLGAPALAGKLTNPSFETVSGGDARAPQLLLNDIDWMKLSDGVPGGDGNPYVADNGVTNNNDFLPVGSIADWTVLDVVDWVSDGFWTAQDGDRCVDLSGSAPGGIYQGFDTSDRDDGDATKRPIYAVEFYLSGNPGPNDTNLGGQGGIRTIEILVGDGTPTINSVAENDVTFSGAFGTILHTTRTFDTDSLVPDIPDPAHDDPIPDMGWQQILGIQFELPDNSLTELTVLFRSLDNTPYGPAIDSADAGCICSVPASSP